MRRYAYFFSRAGSTWTISCVTSRFLMKKDNPNASRASNVAMKKVSLIPSTIDWVMIVCGFVPGVAFAVNSFA